MRTPSRIIAVANLSPILSPFAMPHASRSPLGMNSAALALKHSAVAALAGSCANAYASAVHARDQTPRSKLKKSTHEKYANACERNETRARVSHRCGRVELEIFRLGTEGNARATHADDAPRRRLRSTTTRRRPRSAIVSTRRRHG